MSQEPQPPTTPWWEQRQDGGAANENFSTASTMTCRMEKNKETGQIENRCVKVLRKYRHCVGKQPELVEEVVEESSRPPLLDDGVMGFPPVPGFSVGPPTGGPSPEPSPGMPSELPPRLFEGLFGNPIADVLAKEIFGIEGMQRDADHTPGHPPAWGFRIWGRAPRWFDGGAGEGPSQEKQPAEGDQQQPPKSDWRKGQRFDRV